MEEAKKAGVDVLLVPGLFADSPEYVRYTLDSARSVGIPVIGGFGFMKGRKEIAEAIRTHGAHPALTGLWYSPLWLAEPDRPSDFIRQISKLPITVSDWHGEGYGDTVMNWGTLETLRAADQAKRFVSIGQGGVAAWQLPCFMALKPKGIVFATDLFRTGDVPPVGLHPEIARLVRRAVSMRKLFAGADFTLTNLTEKGDCIELRSSKGRARSLVIANTGAQARDIRVAGPSPDGKCFSWPDGAEVAAKEIAISLPPGNARLFADRPPDEYPEVAAKPMPPSERLVRLLDDKLAFVGRRLDAIVRNAARYEAEDRFVAALRRLEVEFRGLREGEEPPEVGEGEENVMGVKPITTRVEELKKKLKATPQADPVLENEVTVLANEADKLAASLLAIAFLCLPEGAAKLDHLRKNLKASEDAQALRLVNLSEKTLDLKCPIREGIEVFIDAITPKGKVSQTAKDVLGEPPFFSRLNEFGEIVIAPGGERRLLFKPGTFTADRTSLSLSFTHLDEDLPPAVWTYSIPKWDHDKPAVATLKATPQTAWEKQSILWSKGALTLTSPYDRPPSDARLPSYRLRLYREEDEYIALLVTNLDTEPLDLVVCDTSGLVDEIRSTFFTPASTLVRFKQNEYMFSRFEKSLPDRVAGPLPKLNSPAELLVPPGETRELFVTLATRGKQAGRYSGHLVVVALNRESVAALPLEAEVVDLQMPAAPPIAMYAWDYSGGNETEVRSLIRHHFNRFMLGFVLDPSPNEPCFQLKRRHGSFVVSYGLVMELEKLVEEMRKNQQAKDQFDKTLKEVMADEKREEAEKVEGAEEEDDTEKAKKPDYSFMSKLWQKLFTDYLRKLDEGFKSKGLKPDEFIIQVWDEPNDAQAEMLAKCLPLVKKVVPDWVLATDPACGREACEKMAPSIDLWIPHSGSVWGAIFGYQQGVENLAWYKKHGKVWMYTCRANFHTLDANQYSRLYFLKAWIEELDGVALFAASYFDGKGVYPLKVYEGYGQGAEDYCALHLLRQALDEARKAGLTGKPIEDAEEVLRRAPYECIGDDWWAYDPERRTRILDLWKSRIIDATLALRRK